MLIVAGPCAVESRNQVREVCAFLSSLGLRHVRGGAFKPRTAPGTFQGLGLVGWEILREEADRCGLLSVSEVTDARQVPDAARLVDVLQVGARNAQNVELLRAVGASGKPVLLKRGLASTLAEWRGSAEHVLGAGCAELFLCERGHRTYMEHVRFMLDLAGMVEMQREGHKVVTDPSHAAGRADMVEPLAMAALAAGADGLLVEVHPCPEKALSDARQQLGFGEFAALLGKVERFKETWETK